jgi:hypothetical protein
MPRKSRGEPSRGEPGKPKSTTDVVRVEADLAKMANVIATVEGISVSDLISPHLRPFLKKRFAEAVEKLRKQQEEQGA